MGEIYNDSTKRPKSKENQLGILGVSAREFMHFAGNSAEGLGSRRECCWGYKSICENTPKKFPHLSPNNCGNFTEWFKERCSWSIEVTWLRLVLRLHANTSSPDVYWRKQPNWQAHLELCHRNPDILKRVLNWTTLSNSIAGKSAPMQVIKQPEYGRTSKTEEQKWSTFQTNYD